MIETHRRTIRFKLNGRPAVAEIATHETLLEVLRRDFSLFGARESCGQGLCGCCTPGFILMTKELLDRHPQPTTDEIRHYLSGNLCRCAAYPDIVQAVKA